MFEVDAHAVSTATVHQSVGACGAHVDKARQDVV